MENDLKKILTEKYDQQVLSHLYLLEPQFQDRQGLTANFVRDFLVGLNVKEPKSHEDIFWLEATEKKHFVKDEMEPVYQFFKHPPHTLKRKFLIIDNVLKLSELWINKLLKEFEEPAISLTIILTNPEKAELLPTLRSRAILLRLPTSLKTITPLKKDEVEKSLKELSSQSLVDFESIKVFLERLSRAIEEKAGYQELEDFKLLLDAVARDREYNNPLQHSQFRIYDFIQKSCILTTVD